MIAFPRLCFVPFMASVSSACRCKLNIALHISCKTILARQPGLSSALHQAFSVYAASSTLCSCVTQYSSCPGKWLKQKAWSSSRSLREQAVDHGWLFLMFVLIPNSLALPDWLPERSMQQLGLQYDVVHQMAEATSWLLCRIPLNINFSNPSL